MECVVEFEYDANEDDELSLKKGDVITNVTLYEDGWMKGVLNGKEGVFPDNFVKIVKNEAKTPEKSDKKIDGFRRSQEDLLGKKVSSNFDNSNSSVQKAKVIHKYSPRQKDELALEVGMLIDILPAEKDDNDEGWLRGSVGGKVGVFPANFVMLLTPPGGRKAGPHSGGENHDNSTTVGGGLSSGGGPILAGGKKVMGVGFGNIFDGEQIQLRPVAMKDVKREAEEAAAANQAPKQAPRPNKPGAQAESQRRPGAGRTSANMDLERVVVKFPYQGENADELTIDKGDVITVLDKNLEDEGWWKGELNGRVGVFPDNFVEPLPPSGVAPSISKDEKKPIRPVPPPPSDKPAPPEKPNPSKKGGPPVVPKKPTGKSTNGRANSIENKGDIFESVPDHQPLSALTSDRPRVANKKPPSKEFLRASGSVEQLEEVMFSIQPQDVVVTKTQFLKFLRNCHDEELSIEKEEERPFLKRDPPPRPNNRPSGNTIAVEPSSTGKAPGVGGLKSSTLPSAPAPASALPSAIPMAAPSIAPNAVTAGVTASELADLRTEFAQRLSKETGELRAEMEQLRLAFTARLHSLAAEVDEEKRLRMNCQVELERVRRMLQERELSSVSIASAPRSSNA